MWQVVEVHLQKNEFSLNRFLSVEAPHPAIVKAVAMSKPDMHKENQNWAYLVMEEAKGVDLIEYSKYLQKLEASKCSNDKALAAEHKRAIYVQIISAIRHMHHHNIAYRDLKLENARYNPKTRELKLFDFGLSKMIKKSSRSHSFVGSLHYLAPEMLLNIPRLEVRDELTARVAEDHDRGVDMWALGVIIAELELGHSPFDQSGRTERSIIAQNILSFTKGNFEGIPEQGLLQRTRRFLSRTRAPPGSFTPKFDDIKNKNVRSLVKSLVVPCEEKRLSIEDVVRLPLVQGWINEFAKNEYFPQYHVAAPG